MSELTLEALSHRLEAVEQTLRSLTTVIPPARDWRKVVGISEETEFSRQMLADMDASREVERRRAESGEPV